MCDCLHKKYKFSLANKFAEGGNVEHISEGDDCFECALNNFDLDDLDDFETMQYNHHIKYFDKVEALKVLINTVEGDYSQLSPELAKIAEKYYPQDYIEFRDGGTIEAKRRFTDNDFNRLTSDGFYATRSGNVWRILKEGKTRVLGHYNPDKEYLYILGKKDLSNPLVEWLSNNSFVSNEEYFKLADGGSVSASSKFGTIVDYKGKKIYHFTIPFGYPVINAIRDLFAQNEGKINKKAWDNTLDVQKKANPKYYKVLNKEWKDFKQTMEIEVEGENYVNPFYFANGGKITTSYSKAQKWWGNDLSLNEQKEYAKKHLANYEYDELMGTTSQYSTGERRKKFIEKIWIGEGKPESIVEGLYSNGGGVESLDYKYSIIRKWSDNMINDEDIDDILKALVLGGVTDADLHTKPTKTGSQYKKEKEKKTLEIMAIMEKNYTGRLKGYQPYMPIYTMIDRATRFNDNIIEHYKKDRVGNSNYSSGGEIAPSRYDFNSDITELYIDGYNRRPSKKQVIMDLYSVKNRFNPESEYAKYQPKIAVVYPYQYGWTRGFKVVFTNDKIKSGYYDETNGRRDIYQLK